MSTEIAAALFATSEPLLLPLAPPQYTRHGTDYLNVAFGDERELIDPARERLHGYDFDTFVGTGLSGTLVVPLLARNMGKRFLIVRKEEDTKNHSTHKVEGYLGQRWIFVDDLTSSGDTRSRVTDVVNSISASTKFIGTYLYGTTFTPPSFSAAYP